MSNTFIGKNAQDYKKSPTVNVDRVIVNTGSGAAIYSPSGLTDQQWYAMTGKIVSVDIPFGTQTIADSIRTTLAGRPFIPYSAKCAELDPAAELGDWVTIDGVYSVISKRSFYLDSMGTSDISADTENTVTDKYPYISSIEGDVERKISELTSRLIVAEDNITLEVTNRTNADNALGSRITQTQNSITSEVTARTNADTALGTRIDQRLNSISLSVSGTSGTTSFVLKDGSTVLDTETFDLHVKSVNVEGTITADTVKSDWVYAGEIDAEQITSGTISAELIGTGTLTLGNSSTYGMIYLSNNGELGYLRTTMYLANGKGDLYLQSSASNGCVYIEGNGQGYCQLQNYLGGNSSFRPDTDDEYTLGSSSYRWGQIYSSSSSISTSDRTEKKDINYDYDMDTMFDNLKPCSFKFINGASGRTHFGFISQDIEDELIAEGKTGLDFAGFCKDQKTMPIFDDDGHWLRDDIVDGEYRYGLRYEEFIALCVTQIQKLKARVAQLETNAN